MVSEKKTKGKKGRGINSVVFMRSSSKMGWDVLVILIGFQSQFNKLIGYKQE